MQHFPSRIVSKRAEVLKPPLFISRFLHFTNPGFIAPDMFPQRLGIAAAIMHGKTDLNAFFATDQKIEIAADLFTFHDFPVFPVVDKPKSPIVFRCFIG